MTIEAELVREMAYCQKMINAWWDTIAAYQRTGYGHPVGAAYFMYYLWIAQEEQTRTILDSLRPNLALGA